MGNLCISLLFSIPNWENTTVCNMPLQTRTSQEALHSPLPLFNCRNWRKTHSFTTHVCVNLNEKDTVNLHYIGWGKILGQEFSYPQIWHAHIKQKFSWKTQVCISKCMSIDANMVTAIQITELNNELYFT